MAIGYEAFKSLKDFERVEMGIIDFYQFSNIKKDYKSVDNLAYRFAISHIYFLYKNLKDTPIEEMTDQFLEEQMKWYFNSNRIIKEKNWFVYLRSIIFNLLLNGSWFQIEEDKLLKAIEFCLKKGEDVNEKVFTEPSYYRKHSYVLEGDYIDNCSYIHLALNRHYSTQFIVSLIELCKQYGFDVNNISAYFNKTIAHEAIEAKCHEKYNGKILPIIEALGSNFDASIVDSNNNNVYQLISKKLEIIKNKMNAGQLTDNEIVKVKILEFIEDLKSCQEYMQNLSNSNIKRRQK